MGGRRGPCQPTLPGGDGRRVHLMFGLLDRAGAKFTSRSTHLVRTE